MFVITQTPMIKGEFTLIYGCMFAGKTTELLKVFQQNNDASIQVFKPSMDNRSPKDKIQTHNSLSIKSVDVEDPQEILHKMNASTTFVLIDEIQFFQSSIVSVIDTLLNQGHKVFGAGLLLDSTQNSFGAVPILKQKADRLIELFANCELCSKPAEITHRKVRGESTVLLGGKESYSPLCLSCHKSQNGH